MGLNLKNINYGNQSNNADTLVIDYCENKVSFCEIESNTFKPVFIANYIIAENDNNASLLKAINYLDFSKKNYKAVYINYFSEQFTLCPNHFYDETLKKDFLQFNCGSVGTKIILTNDISSNINLIYSIPETLKSLFDQLFPNHQLKHSICVLAQLAINSNEFKNDSILLHINESHIEFIVKQEQQLVLANQFSIKTEQDVLYYLLFLIEQYQLNPLAINVCVSGNLTSDSELYLLLKKYIKNLRLASGHKNLIYTDINGAPQHFNYTLLNRIFCE